MSDYCKITIGDTVKVFFPSTPPITGKVKYMPQATGDAWIIEESITETIYYVQQYEWIRKGG